MLPLTAAGTGVSHSEYNASDIAPVHFLQIWILPGKDGLEPGYEQKTFPDGEKRGQLRLVGSRDGRDGSVTIHQDVDMYATLLGEGDRVSHELNDGRKAWVHVAQGSVLLNDEQLNPGDGVALEGAAMITMTGSRGAEVLVFDMG